MIAAAFKMKEIDLFVFWFILKKLDNMVDGSSFISKQHMLYCMNTLFGVSGSYAYEKLQKGVGKYWGKFGGKKGNGGTSLFSDKRVTERLNPGGSPCNGFEVVLSHFLIHDTPDMCKEKGKTINQLRKDNWKIMKSQLLAMVSAKTTDGRPISYAAIGDQTGLSRSSLWRHISQCRKSGGVHVQTNFVPILTSNDSRELHYKREQLISDGEEKFLTLLKGKELGMYVLAKQLPNSYFIHHYDRVRLSKRPSALKKLDSENLEKISPKRYFNQEPKNANNNNVYILSGHKILDSRGNDVVLWHSNRKRK